jgi:hypothetical protein
MFDDEYVQSLNINLVHQFLATSLESLLHKREKLIEQEGEEEDHDTALSVRLLIDTIDCIGRLRFGRY